jgi:hypothetical protein
MVDGNLTNTKPQTPNHKQFITLHFNEKINLIANEIVFINIFTALRFYIKSLGLLGLVWVWYAWKFWKIIDKVG